MPSSAVQINIVLGAAVEKRGKQTNSCRLCILTAWSRGHYQDFHKSNVEVFTTKCNFLLYTSICSFEEKKTLYPHISLLSWNVFWKIWNTSWVIASLKPPGMAFFPENVSQCALLTLLISTYFTHSIHNFGLYDVRNDFKNDSVNNCLMK